MKVVISGGRVGVSDEAVWAVLDRLSATWPKDTWVIQGAARGVDEAAGKWAENRGYPMLAVPIKAWLDGFKNDAPKNRNRRMLDLNPDFLVAFPGGPGTRHMIEIADRNFLPIYDVEIEGSEFKVWKWGPVFTGLVMQGPIAE